MKSVISQIDLNAKCPIYTLREIENRLQGKFPEWKMRKDMIKRVAVCSCDYGFLQLGIDYESGAQGVGYGYRSEGNIGMMILALADLVGVKNTNGDILEAMRGKPIRVLFKEDFGGSVAGCTYIGHFMADKWMHATDLIVAGIVNEETRTEDGV